MNNVVIEFMKLVHPEYDEVPTSINSEDIHTHLRDATELIQEATKLIQELKAENEELKKALKRFGHHDSPCSALLDASEDEECICGFDEILKRE